MGFEELEVLGEVLEIVIPVGLVCDSHQLVLQVEYVHNEVPQLFRGVVLVDGELLQGLLVFELDGCHYKIL